MKLRAWKPRTPVQGTVASGAASASSMEQSSGSDFINQYWVIGGLLVVGRQG